MSDKMFPVLIYIRNNETGEVRQYADELIEGWDAGQPSIFIWEDGNFSCDCNRRLFFARVKGEDEDWEGDCSDGKFSVNIRDTITNQGYYKEFELEAENAKG